MGAKSERGRASQHRTAARVARWFTHVGWGRGSQEIKQERRWGLQITTPVEVVEAHQVRSFPGAFSELPHAYRLLQPLVRPIVDNRVDEGVEDPEELVDSQLVNERHPAPQRASRASYWLPSSLFLFELLSSRALSSFAQVEKVWLKTENETQFIWVLTYNETRRRLAVTHLFRLWHYRTRYPVPGTKYGYPGSQRAKLQKQEFSTGLHWHTLFIINVCWWL